MNTILVIISLHKHRYKYRTFFPQYSHVDTVAWKLRAGSFERNLDECKLQVAKRREQKRKLVSSKEGISRVSAVLCNFSRSSRNREASFNSLATRGPMYAVKNRCCIIQTINKRYIKVGSRWRKAIERNKKYHGSTNPCRSVVCCIESAYSLHLL